MRQHSRPTLLGLSDRTRQKRDPITWISEASAKVDGRDSRPQLWLHTTRTRQKCNQFASLTAVVPHSRDTLVDCAWLWRHSDYIVGG